MEKFTAREVIPTTTVMPKYVRKAAKTKYLCFGGFNKDGGYRADIGLAVMRNGELIPIEWGGNGGTLSMAEVKEIRKADHNQEFIYIGKVYDSLAKESRDNFAKVIHF